VFIIAEFVFTVNLKINIYMQHYREVNLLSNPLKPGALEELESLKNNYSTQIMDVRKYLNPKLIYELMRLKLDIKGMSYFGAPREKNYRTLIHTDLEKHPGEDDFKISHVVLNWDITPGTSTFEWWDTKHAKVIHPGENSGPLTYRVLEYVERDNRVIPDYFELLETYDIKMGQPFIARSGIPHSVYYVAETDYRRCVSLRFRSNPTWDEALEIFKPYFIPSVV
jgi:hypothetical protein